jgi:subtilisin family serine protease
MSRILTAAFAKGLVLIGAAGNAGHASPPLYPAADAEVIAATAIDAEDKLYEKANTGSYIAVAAPGVDVLLPTPGGNYDLQSGTSVSAALVSGVAALVLERRPKLAPGELRKVLTSTAKPLGSPDQRTEFGAGLVDVGRALAQAAGPLPTQ